MVAARVYQPVAVDVAGLRKRLDLTREQLPRALVFPWLPCHWERGDRNPHGPALVLLNLIDRDPKAVMHALG